MPLLPSPDDDRFREFSRGLRDPMLLQRLTEVSGVPQDLVARRIELAIGESAQTLRLLAGIEISASARLLEVGAGLGVASHFLASIGHDVTALEPGGLGFELHSVLAGALRTVHGRTASELGITAEALSPEEHGRFDLVFSNNVIEHTPTPVDALSAVRAVTTDGGWCVHSCPNYRVPFEPHFGIPLLPFRPALTARLLPRPIREGDVWASLNFLTSSTVREAAASVGCAVYFRPAALAGSVERLTTDQQFAERHRRLATAASGARRLGLVSALRRLPASWSTPMHFVLADDAVDPDALERWLSS
jgi:2-polyprenyl-3-methyl-5-hydroxy-6-metoxy-1,4-benzoquinol methylase